MPVSVFAFFILPIYFSAPLFALFHLTLPAPPRYLTNRKVRHGCADLPSIFPIHFFEEIHAERFA
jgi:hypothetical protein